MNELAIMLFGQEDEQEKTENSCTVVSMAYVEVEKIYFMDRDVPIAIIVRPEPQEIKIFYRLGEI
jgi:hypothetical protein